MFAPFKLPPGSFNLYGLGGRLFVFLVDGERLYELNFACDG
jgi:hypothetical protein